MFTSRSFKIIIFACICALCGLVLFIYTASILAQRGAVLQEKIQLFADEQTHQQEYAQLVNRLAETESERERLPTYILNGNDETVALLSQLERFATAVGVDMVTTKLEVLSDEDSMQDTLEISLDIDGTDDAVKQFLNVLETIPFHSYIASADVTRSTDQITNIQTTQSSITLAVSLHKE